MLNLQPLQLRFFLLTTVSLVTSSYGSLCIQARILGIKRNLNVMKVTKVMTKPEKKFYEIRFLQREKKGTYMHNSNSFNFTYPPKSKT